MSIKSLMKDYKWNSQELKRKYQFCDFTALGLVVVILLLVKFIEGSMPYIWITIACILLLEWYCFKVKKQDKLNKK